MKITIIASSPSITAPVREITPRKFLIPKRYSNNGEKQAINQEVFSGNFKSCRKIFFKVKPRVIKEVKVVRTPKTKPRGAILSPIARAKPEKASGEVLVPLTPRMIKINER